MPAIVVVALPKKNELVNDISSEKKAHMTLLYLDAPMGVNEEHIIQFVQFASGISLKRFGLSVDRRGTLGPDDADVLFFDSKGAQSLRDFRAELLKDDTIATHYVKTDQFPGWVPHLTLGYPAKPAKEVDRNDRYGLNFVSFDRIAVWTKDFDGPEFDLGESRATMVDPVVHSGVKGMHWGVRKDDSTGSSKTAGSKTGKTSANLKSRSKQVLNSGSHTFNTKSVKKLNDDPRFKGKNLNKNKKLQDEYNLAAKAAFRSDVIRTVKTAALVTGAGATLAVGFSTGFSVPVMASLATSAVRGVQNYVTNSNAALADITNQANQIARDAGTESRRLDAVTYTNSIKSPGYVITGDGAGHASGSTSFGDTFNLDLTHADPLVFVVQFEIDENGFVTSSTVEPDEIKHMDEGDYLEHFGVRGMKWGVRRPTNSSGLVTGSVGSAKRSPDAPAGRTSPGVGASRKSKVALDHKKLQKNVKKDVSQLSTDEIKQITNRLKAVKELKAVTDAQKEAQRSVGNKLARWALGAVATGAKQAGESYIKELTGDTIRDILPKTATQKAKDSKEKEKQQEKADKKAKESSSEKTAREQAVRDLRETIADAAGVYKITDVLPRKGG